ncbi:MAG: hypothetical protein DCF15_19370 [Phormidesmis priestleyi]|uniref:Uncharacterized protein n=1 Tax=Phormidesmis priestleyi TaxID=268141 RepID=A0A2W4WRJ7_9CYAN|nr:MAG: hypothetical protein DCF15_19370 [Phormidesmis priestleyi]
MAFLLNSGSRTAANRAENALQVGRFSRGHLNRLRTVRGHPRTARGQAEDGGDQGEREQYAASGE